LVTKVNAVEGGTTSVARLHQHNQPTHVTDGMEVMSLSATSKTRRVTTDHLYQIVLNRKVV
jgi:hypothetical protein